MALSIISPAFKAGGSMPTQHTCDGADTSPPLQWSGVPAGTKSLALIVDDPDAPDPAKPQRTYVHWVVYNLPPDSRELSLGVTTRDLPPGTREGTNDWNRTGYGGPCPPVGRHRYFFKLYALDTILEKLNTPAKTDLEAAMRDHLLERAELVGTYERAKRKSGS